MATIKYLIKGNNNPSTIFVRLIDGRKIDLSTSTTLTINPTYWSNDDKGKVKQRATFKDKLNFEKKLNKLSGLISDERNIAQTNNQPINLEWLNNIVLSWKGLNDGKDSDLLKHRIEFYRDSLKTKVNKGTKKMGVSPSTIKNFNTTILHLTKFETDKKHSYRLTELDFTFHTQYIKFCQSNLGLSPNTIGKDIRQIKTVSLDSFDNGFKVHDNVLTRKFDSPSEDTMFTTLNETELKLINEFEGADYLTNAKDWLIIGCWTGCRVNDLMKLTMDNVVFHPNGTKLIQYTQNKTDKTVNVPMHPYVEVILSKRNGFPRPISDQRFNEYIKDVCELVGLTQLIEGTRQNPKSHKKETGNFEKWKLIKSHTCRRSFATNHYNKLPNKLIMAVTGHATESMLLNYIGEVENDHVQDYMDLWTKEKQTAPIQLESMKIG